MTICDALHDLVAFVRFKKREKHLRRSVTFSKVYRLKPATLLKVTLLHRCFSRFFKLCKCYQIAQRTACEQVQTFPCSCRSENFQIALEILAQVMKPIDVAYFSELNSQKAVNVNRII